LLTWLKVNRSLANQLLGTVYQRLGRREDAERALLASDDSPVYWADPWMAEVTAFDRNERWKSDVPKQLVAAGRTDEALLMLERLLQEEPDHPTLLNNLGIVYRTVGRIDEAINAHTRSLQLNENLADGHFNIALSYLMRIERETDESQIQETVRRVTQHLDALERLNPTYEGAYGIRGFLRERLGDTEGAIEAYRLAGRRIEGSEAWLGRLANLLLTAGRWEEAIEVLDQLGYRYTPQPKFVYQLAVAQLNAGRLEAALATVDHFRTQWPDDNQAAQLRGAIEQRLARRDAGTSPNQ
jgi:tetratricopeptide (TPR) repeat protein